jgi:hypothetical protein
VVVVRPLSFQAEGLMPRVTTVANRPSENRPGLPGAALGFLSSFAVREKGAVRTWQPARAASRGNFR